MRPIAMVPPRHPGAQDRILVTVPPSIRHDSCVEFHVVRQGCRSRMEEQMRGATFLVAVVGAVTVLLSTMTPAHAWYDQWGRWHPNHRWGPPGPPPPGYYYRPPPPPVYYAPPAYYRPPPPVYGYGPGVSIGVRIP
jgi:hypothetical protein